MVLGIMQGLSKLWQIWKALTKIKAQRQSRVEADLSPESRDDFWTSSNLEPSQYHPLLLPPVLILYLNCPSLKEPANRFAWRVTSHHPRPQAFTLKHCVKPFGEIYSYNLLQSVTVAKFDFSMVQNLKARQNRESRASLAAWARCKQTGTVRPIPKKTVTMSRFNLSNRGGTMKSIARKMKA